ncbi:glycoside hydrolase family 3 N-terminal domain-containing protein [Amycolatopsis sp. NPDC026612]|uniref:glycoside hydrolase family 3 N-terminal domain-containing protein n=1 Tax=Amycolatopsis sp. NPDC026612 TaxID=3155466 RepID=UPI0033F4F730
MRYRSFAALVFVAGVAVLVAARPTNHGQEPPVRSGTPDPAATSPATAGERPPWHHELLGGNAESCASAAARTLDLPALAWQLFLIGTPLGVKQPASPAPGAGGFLLTGRSSAGVDEIARSTAALANGGPARIRPLVAVDQEGGAVQALRGPGFSRIPPATVQGGWPGDGLRAAAQRWGTELAQAGVSLDLGPVVDVVPAGRAKANAPIGAVNRQLGSDVPTIVAAAKSITSGLRDAGIGVVYKHFPGLGMVSANTDYRPGVVDSGTGADSPSVDVYRQALPASGASVMISTAVYSRLDRQQPAAFSTAVVTRLLRSGLAFGGVVISDDLANADQVRDVPAPDRAMRFLSAGGDLVIAADPRIGEAMYQQVAATAAKEPRFAGQVRASALRVLALKASLGLVDCRAWAR